MVFFRGKKMDFPPKRVFQNAPGRNSIGSQESDFLATWQVEIHGTPAKTNMEPENEPLDEEIPMKNHHFQVPC